MSDGDLSERELLLALSWTNDSAEVDAIGTDLGFSSWKELAEASRAALAKWRASREGAR